METGSARFTPDAVAEQEVTLWGGVKAGREVPPAQGILAAPGAKEGRQATWGPREEVLWGHTDRGCPQGTGERHDCPADGYACGILIQRGDDLSSF